MFMADPINRRAQRARVSELLGRNPAVALLGARQVGKTTLARDIAASFAGNVTHFDLENPDDLARLHEPMLALGRLDGLVVIDEVQRRADLFPVLRVLIDRPLCPCRFLLLGSASRDLLRQSSESLAGRIAYHQLPGFGIDEVGESHVDRLWLRGAFPRAFLADSDQASYEWRVNYIRTVVERDLPQLGIGIPSATMHRFWRMLAHYHGQVLNNSELGRAFGVAHTTIRRYLDALAGALLVHSLQPWHANLGKRQVKTPKVYIADSGITHALLGVTSRFDLDGHPKVGATWEGFVLDAIIRRLGAPAEDCYFWAAHAGPELDLLVMDGMKRRGFEIKRTTAPSTTRSMWAARELLKLDSLDVVHAGEHTFALADGIRALAFADLQTAL